MSGGLLIQASWGGTGAARTTDRPRVLARITPPPTTALPASVSNSGRSPSHSQPISTASGVDQWLSLDTRMALGRRLAGFQLR